MIEISKSVRAVNAGFTMLELMVSMAILLVLSSAAIGGMTYFQKNYRASEQRKSMQAQLRATVEQMSQEIGQAGLIPSGLTGNGAYNQTVVSALAYLTASSSAGTLTPLSVTSTAGMFRGEWLILDTPDLNYPLGTPEERVQIQSINNSTSITVAATAQPHTVTGSNVPVMAQGVYPTGVWNTWATGGTLPNPTAGITYGTAPTLTIFGDINGDGTMVIVKYQCPVTTPGPLLRNLYYVSNTGCGPTATPDVSTTLIDDVLACQFTYPPTPATLTSSGATYSTSVGVSLTVQSRNIDPQTHSHVTVTKNILNIQPRNIVNAYNMDLKTSLLPSGKDEFTNESQTLPTTLTPQNILASTCIP